MHNELHEELQNILSLLWIHIQSEKQPMYSCDEGVYQRFLAYSSRPSAPRTSLQKTSNPPITKVHEKPSMMGDDIPMEKQPPKTADDEEVSPPEQNDETLHAAPSQKRHFDKLLPRSMQNQSMDISHVRKEMEALQGMPSLKSSSLYPEHAIKTGKWAFIHHMTPGKESFFQSVVKATHDKLKITTATLDYSDPLFLSKLPMYAAENDFLFFFVEAHLEEKFTREIKAHIEPYQGTKTASPFIILGKKEAKPLYALILSPNSQDDISFKKNLWERLKLFHTQYTS